jgi:hypothetical protein
MGLGVLVASTATTCFQTIPKDSLENQVLSPPPIRTLPGFTTSLTWQGCCFNLLLE